MKKIHPLIPELPQLETQIEVEATIDLATEIGIEQIDLIKKQTEKSKNYH